jgi:hypothetical protein
MNRINPLYLTSFVLFLAIAFSSCQAIADIFKAGVWVGVIIVVAIIGLILWVVGKSKK